MAEVQNKTNIYNDSKLEKSVEEQDEHIFGLLNSEISDALAAYVREAIVESVGSLPLVPDQEKAQALTQKIERSSMRNIDIMEAYGSRNIFTLRQYPRHRRLWIVRESRKDSSLEEPPTKSERMEKYPRKDRDQPQSINLPKNSETPSRKEMNELEDELLQLKRKLNAARLLRNDLVSKYQGLETAIVVSNAAVTSLSQVSSENISAPVNQVVSCGTNLQDFSNECKEIIHQLDASKQLRSGEEENEQIRAATKKIKRKRLSMEEEYKIDRKVLQSKNVASLNVLRSLLKR